MEYEYRFNMTAKPEFTMNIINFIRIRKKINGY